MGGRYGNNYYGLADVRYSERIALFRTPWFGFGIFGFRILVRSSRVRHTMKTSKATTFSREKKRHEVEVNVPLNEREKGKSLDYKL